jgi:predicted GNAT family acetyltransferase
MNADFPDPVPLETTLVRNDAESQYELWAGDALVGLIVFRSRPGRIVLIHTEVDERFEGHGLGGRLVSGALDDVRARGLHATPLCPFVATYMQEHPEYAELVGAVRPE